MYRRTLLTALAEAMGAAIVVVEWPDLVPSYNHAPLQETLVSA
jgi:hypothetical protein